MKVSFLVTYYNQAQYVKQSIESILSIQFPCDYEILIGDDGSTDGTIDLINEYIYKYPTIISLYIMPRDNTQKYNSILRASANRLNLLSHATGDFFCTLDGDDFYCDTTFISEALEIFKQYPSISVCGFNYQLLTNDTISPTKNKIHENYISATDFIKNYYNHSGACVFKQCNDSKRIQFLKDTLYFDDNDIVLNNLFYGDFYFTNKIIYNYRQTGTSIWTSVSYMEQSIANAIDYTVLLKILPSRKKELSYRFLPTLLYIYLRKNKITDYLSKDKLNKYISTIDNSFIFYKIATYDTLTINDRNKLIYFFLIESICHPILWLKEIKHFILNK